MHVLFVHQNFPAQFGHIARAIARDKGWQSTVVCGNPTGTAEGPNIIQYELKGGATEKTHYCSRSFENAVAHCLGVFEACRQHRELRPDLVVGHSGFGSTLFLRELRGWKRRPWKVSLKESSVAGQKRAKPFTEPLGYKTGYRTASVPFRALRNATEGVPYSAHR